jgi:predicted nucleotidyltransferase
VRVDVNEVRSCLSLHRHLFQEAYLYGSVARGTEDEHSDVDLVLIRDTSLSFFDRIREVFDLVFALGKVDLMIYTDRERRDIIDGPGRYFMKDVFQKGIRVEGAQGRSTSVAAAG